MGHKGTNLDITQGQNFRPPPTMLCTRTHEAKTRRGNDFEEYNRIYNKQDLRPIVCFQHQISCIFRALSSKLRISLKVCVILKITLLHFNPLQHQKGQLLNFGYLAKKSYIQPIIMYANFQGSSIKTYHFENKPYCTFNPPQHQGG